MTTSCRQSGSYWFMTGSDTTTDKTTRTVIQDEPWTLRTEQPIDHMSDDTSIHISPYSTSDNVQWRGLAVKQPSTDVFMSHTDELDLHINGDLSIEGDLSSEKFEKRILGIMEDYMHQYINNMIPLIMSMAADRWIPIIGQVKRMNGGVFCFNCGAAIMKHKENEPCDYCGR